MATIIIDEKTTDAKRMLAFLKTQRYAKIIDERKPGASLLKSMEEARTGKTKEMGNTEDYFNGLRKRANV